VGDLNQERTERNQKMKPRRPTEQKASKSNAKAKRNRPASAKPSEANGSDNFLIAAVGASAGGLEAFTDLLRNLPL
jgi:chemotaxis response regulator CheB